MPIAYIAYPNSPQLRSANAVQTHATVRELKRIAPDTLVIVPRMKRGPSAFDALGVVHLPRIGIGRLSRLYRTTLLYYAERSAWALMVAAYLWAIQALRGHRYEVVYVREVICAFWLALLLPRLTGARVVYEVHDLESRNPSRAKEPWATGLLHLLDRVVLTRPAALTSLTDAFRRQLAADGLRFRDEVAVLPDAFDPALYHPGDRDEARRELGIAPETTLVVYAGLTFAYRGLDVLLDAVEIARHELLTLRVALVGGRPQEIAALSAQAGRLGIDNLVDFVGPQDQPTVARYMLAADMLVIPDTVSDVTASPLKLFEYMATGRAVICPDIAALREITAGDGAIHIPRQNAAILAETLVRLAGDGQQRDELGRNAIARVAPYTYAQRAERLLAIARAVGSGEPIGNL
jgi:glycosyltransferase involved in cell wall biosynthesis